MYLASISSKLVLCDSSTWEFKKSYGCYDGCIRDINWSDDGKYLLQVNPKGLVEILNTTENEIRSLQHVPFRDTWCASFHRDGHRNIAIGTKNGSVIIWDTKVKTITKTFPNSSHQSCINFVSYNAKNTSLAATMQNGDTIVYGLVSNIPVSTIKLPCSKSISAMKFHHEIRPLLGLATDEGHIVLRDITTNKDRTFYENVHASLVSDFSFSLINKDVMFSTGYDKYMHVYDIRMQNIVSSIKTSVTLTSVAPDIGNHVALSSTNGYILIYDLRDLTIPLKTLKNHNEEVCKVAFQPSKHKGLADLSLKDDSEMLSVPKARTPVKSRTSDVFWINESPQKNNSGLINQGMEKEDSFLVMMGIDNDIDDESSKLGDSLTDKKWDKNKPGRTEAEKNVTKASTPLNNKTAENFGLPSPISINVCNENEPPNEVYNNPSCKPSIVNSDTRLDSKSVEELKDFFKSSLSEISDNNRDYFLHIMMALTKEKLYLQKQLSSMSEQMQNLLQNQNALIETNRRLTYEIEQLKSRQQSHKI